jgi:hypothetical protein
MTKPIPDAMARPISWPWVVLGLGLVWAALIRVPLILNAEDHLDSDLAVDGLTLLDATHGRWRWHYPGTPYIGIVPIFFSYPQALAWGANAVTLVSGGTVIWLALIGATFWLARKAYGPAVGAWAILPLVFSTPGTIWLSGRITGGHLLTLVWHTLALVGLHACLTRGGWLRAAALGFWCGLGLYLDAMFLFTMLPLMAAAVVAWIVQGRTRAGVIAAGVFIAAACGGLLPREIGRWVDSFDAYPAQFELTFDRAALLEHSRLLGYHCLPRLLAGVEFHNIQRQITGAARPSGTRSSPAAASRDSVVQRSVMEGSAVLVLVVFVIGFIRLWRDPARRADLARKAVGRSVCWSSLLIVAAFLVNRNIFDSDNYRYLIHLVTAWTLGFGLLCGDLTRQGKPRLIGACVAASLFGALMTATTFRWYHGDRGYITDRAWPIRIPVQPWAQFSVEARQRAGSPRTRYQYTVPAEVTHVFGGYWDVYRIAFLSGGRIAGIPFPMYPNRFPGWSRGLGPGQGTLLALPPDLESRLGSPQLDGGPVNRNTRRPVRISDSSFWFDPLMTVWQGDGRAPSELKQVRVLIPSPELARR